MDSITQAALGAAVGEAMLGKKLGNRALLWGLFFGTLPDLDVLVSFFLDTTNNLIWHRGPSHSLLVMVIASAALGHWLAKLWKKQKISRGQAGLFVFAVWSTHVLLDCFTVYGTSVLWPFTEKRIAFNNLFIIDPFYTVPLLVTLVWLAFLRTKKQLAKRRRLCWWGLGLSSGYVAVSLLAKWAASAGFDADLRKRGVTFTRRMEAPTTFNILFWRSVVDRGDELWVGYRSIFEFHDTPVRWTVYPKGTDAYFPYSAMREAKTVAWFSDGWWICRPHKQGIWLGDLRFGETRTWNARKDSVDSRVSFSWVFHPKAEGEKLRQLMPESRNPGETMKRLAKRVAGDRAAWEAQPRLAGVHGSLPEVLRAEQ
ncbi:MAG: metal-dependent hydrolase [Akkermansiaceae bacterium]|nr:metal-dependent hydrolase [Akkermansiaceae bacterium]